MTTAIQNAPIPEQPDVVGKRLPDAERGAALRERLSAKSPLGRDEGAPAAPEEPVAEAPAPAAQQPAPEPAAAPIPAEPAEPDDPELAAIAPSDRVAFAKAYKALIDNPETRGAIREKILEISRRTPAEAALLDEQAAPQAPQADESLRREVRELKAAHIVQAFTTAHPDFAKDQALRAETLAIIKQDRVPLERAYQIALAERIVRGHQAANHKTPAPPERQTAGGATSGDDALAEMEKKAKGFKRTTDAVRYAFNEAVRRGLPMMPGS